MNKYKEYVIILRGCDDITKIKYLLSDNELQFLIKFGQYINKFSHHDCCKPTIHLFEDNISLKKIDLFNLSDFDDLVGGYYE